MPAFGNFPAARSRTARRRKAALVRELAEELGIDIAGADLAPLTFASHGYPEFHLLMPLYLCRRWRGNGDRPRRPGAAMGAAEEIGSYAMPPADEPLKVLLPGLLADANS